MRRRCQEEVDAKNNSVILSKLLLPGRGVKGVHALSELRPARES